MQGEEFPAVGCRPVTVGFPLGDVYSADLDLAQIPVFNLARIAVSRGTASALYGTGGAAGVVLRADPFNPGPGRSLSLGWAYER